MNCIDCEKARQVGDKSRIDVVGCCYCPGDVMDADKWYKDQRSSIQAECIYEGYRYQDRRPGDTEESNEFGKGVLSLGLIVPADATCKYFLAKV